MMRHRRWAYAGAVALAVGLAVVARYGLFARTADSGASGFRAEQSARANVDSTLAPRSSLQRSVVYNEPPRAGRTHVDIARVEAALLRLHETTARITQVLLTDEQRKMAEAKARFEAIKAEEPKIRPFTDTNGAHWIELRHASGEIRYELAPDEPAPEIGAVP